MGNKLRNEGVDPRGEVETNALLVATRASKATAADLHGHVVVDHAIDGENRPVHVDVADGWVIEHLVVGVLGDVPLE